MTDNTDERSNIDKIVKIGEILECAVFPLEDLRVFRFKRNSAIQKRLLSVTQIDEETLYNLLLSIEAPVNRTRSPSLASISSSFSSPSIAQKLRKSNSKNTIVISPSSSSYSIHDDWNNGSTSLQSTQINNNAQLNIDQNSTHETDITHTSNIDKEEDQNVVNNNNIVNNNNNHHHHQNVNNYNNDKIPKKAK